MTQLLLLASTAPDAPPALPVVLSIFVLPVLWFGVSGLLSLLGGWHALSTRYGVPSPVGGEPFIFSSGSLRRGLLPTNYNHCLTVRVSERGVGLSVIFLFRFMHPPLLIPWTAIQECRKGWFLLWPGVELRLEDPRIRIVLRGRGGSAVHEQWTRMQGAPAAGAVP